MMKIDIEEQDARIETFLKGKMSPSEATAFKTELKSDKALRERAITMAMLIKAMKKVGTEEDKNIIQEIITNKSAVPKHKSISLFMRIAVAAAIVGTVFIVDYQLAKTNTQTLASEYLAYAPQLLPIEGELRGANTNERNIEAQLIPLFENVKKELADDENIKHLSELYLLASSDKLNDYSDYMDIIGYYLAIAYMQNNDKEKAKQLLSKLAIDNPDNAEINNLLKSLSTIKGIW